jgi:pyruvate-formate lyase
MGGAVSERIGQLQRAVNGAPPSVCPERALLWTAQHRRSEAAGTPVALRMAESLAHVLARKTVRIYPGELLVGNYTSKRVGGLIAPELHGIITLLELHTLPERTENPLRLSKGDLRALQRLIPYWLTRNLPYRTHASMLRRARFLAESVRSRDWVINELGGIAHFAPDYERLLQRGAEGLTADVRAAVPSRPSRRPGELGQRTFHEAVRLLAEALGRFGDRYADHAQAAARRETDTKRRGELETIARICRRVPRHGARTFHEALQSMFLTHVAIVNEGLDVTICPGRLDQTRAGARKTGAQPRGAGPAVPPRIG